MQRVGFILSSKTLCHRFFSTSLPLFSGPPYRSENYVLSYKGPYRIYPHKVLYKLLFRKKKNTSFFFKPPVGQPSISIQTAASCGTAGHVASSKRVLILNKLFMRYIPEVMTTSEFGDKLYGHDLQISHVKINADYSQVKVYWIPKGTDADEVVEKLLNEIAGPLRQEMINLRVMGIVPRIRFCKDKFRALMAEVDRRLKIADFGDDFVPTVFTEDILKKQLQLRTTLPIEIKSKLMQLENEEPICEDEEMEIPTMKFDVFGLNYEQTRKSIALGIKNKRVERLALVDEKTLLGESAVAEVKFNFEAQRSEPLDKKAFVKYLRKIKIERKKMLKEQAKEFKKQALLDSASFQSYDNEEEDELYTEFVKNAFEDYVEDFDDENLVKHEQT